MAGKRMVDMLRFSPEGKMRKTVRLIRIGGKSFGDGEEFGLGEADQGAAQQRAECEGVTRVRDCACNRDEILNFLSPEKPLSSLGRNRDSALLDCLLEAP